MNSGDKTIHLFATLSSMSQASFQKYGSLECRSYFFFGPNSGVKLTELGMGVYTKRSSRRFPRLPIMTFLANARHQIIQRSMRIKRWRIRDSDVEMLHAFRRT